MATTTFYPKQIVTIVTGGRGAAEDRYEIVRVKVVTAKFVELTDGSRWLLDGSGRYPRKRLRIWDPGQWLIPTTKEHGDILKHRRLVSQLSETNWQALDLSTLKAVAALLPQEKDPT